ncbi:hypothetical protein EDB86DRAFT_2904669 [Lactarius hatsudake]|nr:hypothetical protein EDB86DRAFT_2904669 [Lactarius hatsudake]
MHGQWKSEREMRGRHMGEPRPPVQLLNKSARPTPIEPSQGDCSGNSCRLTTHLKNWEDNGWIGIKNAKLFKRVAYLLKRRTAPTWVSWVKGHAGILGNEESDKLAKEGAEKRDAERARKRGPGYRYNADVLSLNIPVIFDIQGAKLETLSQAVAYKGIRLLQVATLRPTEGPTVSIQVRA